MKPVLLFLLLVCVNHVFSQENYYLIFLTDKEGGTHSLSRPEEFLSQRAIERRIQQNIALDETDLPVSPVYLDSLAILGLEKVCVSKWLNTVTVKSDNSELMDTLQDLSFVDTLWLTKPGLTVKSLHQKFDNEQWGEVWVNDSSDYGYSWKQLALHKGEWFDSLGYLGEGMHIALLDNGFNNVAQNIAFDSLYAQDRVLGTRDFVNPGGDVYTTGTHGMQVLSVMASNIPGQLLGIARHANYWLLRTEDNASEYTVEEDFWIAGAEFADSAGVDIISSSLGYAEFDDPAMDYTREDLDGQTIRVTKAANLAFQKGILVVNSAGNEGNDPWKYIIAPSDGTGVISVGAVNVEGTRADFSSMGPGLELVKPNVMSVGQHTYGLNSLGNIATISGTSYSAPMLSSLAACLWQYYPEKTNAEIKQMIEEGGDRYAEPDTLYGYGIPDFYKILDIQTTAEYALKSPVKVFPNPFSRELRIILPPEVKGVLEVSLYCQDGVKVFYEKFSAGVPVLINKLAGLGHGMYVLEVKNGNNYYREKVVK